MQRVDISRPFHTRQGRCYPPAYEPSQTNFGSNFRVLRADLLPNAVVDESTNGWVAAEAFVPAKV
jgi:hypothetical protein